MHLNLFFLVFYYMIYTYYVILFVIFALFGAKFKNSTFDRLKKNTFRMSDHTILYDAHTDVKIDKIH